ncbi:MAG: phage tail tip lysozyme [Beijerinckiaceae bacterium]
MTAPWISDYSAAQIANAATIQSFWLNYASDPVAVGFVANADRETSLDPKAVGDNDTAYNIGQWHWQPRGAAILAGCGVDVRTCSLENALIAMHWELTTLETTAWAKIRACTTPQTAAQAICIYYERAGAANALARSAALAAMWGTHFAQTAQTA